MLPSSLWDVLSLRLSSRAYPVYVRPRATSFVRHVQQLAAQTIAHETHLKEHRGPSEVSARHSYPLKAQGQVSELAARVEALKEIANETIKSAEIQQTGPHFQETELREIYKDLLMYPAPAPPQEQSSAEIAPEPVGDILQILAQRLPEFEAAAQENSSEALSARLQARIHSSPPRKALVDVTKTYFSMWQGNDALWGMIRRLQVVLQSLESKWMHVTADDASTDVKPTLFRLLSDAEWNALSEACLEVDDPDAAIAVLELMKSAGLKASEDQRDLVLKWFAIKGKVQEADAYVVSLGLDVPSELHRDQLIKARLYALQLADACTLLHTYEARKIPAPMKSYTRIIQALFKSGDDSPQHTAQAWDLFAHMRYVAHPVPDAFLYNTMIRAAPEPVRALDLFTEMTTEKGIVPMTHSYNAVIRACARSKEYALDAFRLARQMLDSNRDAFGNVPVHLRPDTHTYDGLLEAAKRIGDLSRARWVLAEMAQGSYSSSGLIYITFRSLNHMFHAYAAYNPPFRREDVSIVPEETPPENQEPSETASPRGLEAIGLSRRGLPQSRQEVVREAELLWARVLDDIKIHDSDSAVNHDLLFGKVTLNPKLLNAYLLVHYTHSPPAKAYELYFNLYDSLGIKRDSYSYVYALEAFASKGKGRTLSPSELSFVLATARKIWQDWELFESTQEKHGTEARLIQRAWCAMIRLLTMTGNDREAENLFRRFVELYPPQLVKEPSPVDPTRSNRIRLYAERPLVRLLEPSTVPENNITPFILFHDVALLHHRAVFKRNKKLIGFLKWAVSAYSGALRQRRSTQLHSQ